MNHMGRKRNVGKHEQAIFYLPSDLLQKLKLRRVQTGESASSFVSRVLRNELYQEDKRTAFDEFKFWCKIHKRCKINLPQTVVPAKYQDFYTDELAYMMEFGVWDKHPDKWTAEEKRTFGDLWRIKGHFIDDNPSRIFEMENLNKKEFMKSYNFKWEVKE